MSPDYRLAPKHRYPLGLQDVVDVYLAISGQIESNLNKVLPNVKPKKIICMGDSAGGHFCFALSRVLAELKIELPKELVVFFPCGPPSMGSRYPSRIFQMIDTVLPPAPSFGFSDMYCSGNALTHC